LKINKILPRGCITHVALQVIGLPGLDHIGGVRQAGPVVQVSPVVEVVDLLLALLGQLEVQHVHRQVELGLGLVEVLLVEGVTGDLGRVHSQHDQRVVVDAEGSNVVAHLLAVPCVVLVLCVEKGSCFRNVAQRRQREFIYTSRTSLMISRPRLAATIETASDFKS